MVQTLTAEAYGLSFLYPASDTALGPALARYGEFARPQRDFLLNQAGTTPATFVDLGANIGAISIPFAKHRPDWRVIAVEAHGGLAGLLAANALNNGCAGVEALHAAAGNQRRVADFPTIPLTSRENVGTSSFHDASRPTAPVLMLPLDEIAPDDTALVKIDVEGFEEEVLDGAARVLREVRPVWFVEAVYERPRRAVMQRFLDTGYSIYWFYAPWVTRRPLKGPTPSAADTTTGDANVVAVPPGRRLAWPLPPARPDDPTWPTDAALYPYLRAYGY